MLITFVFNHCKGYLQSFTWHISKLFQGETKTQIRLPKIKAPRKKTLKTRLGLQKTAVFFSKDSINLGLI